MKNAKAIAILAAALALAVGGIAEARPGGGGGGSRGGHGGHGGHSHHYGGGRGYYYAAPIFAGAYFASRYYYPPSYYYPPAYYPPVYYPPTAPTYIEQPVPYSVPPQSQYQQPQTPPQDQVQPDSQSHWYYCEASRGYYPHVQTCPGGWQRVAPQSPPR